MTKFDDALSNIINKAVQGMDSATSFLSSQVPDVIHQVLVWHAAQSGILLIACAACIWVILNKLKPYLCNESNDAAFFGTLCYLVSCFPIFGCIFCVLDIVEIWLAPKVWLIEYAASLVSNNT